MPDSSDPLWYKDAIIYELHIRAFADSNGDGIGDITGLIDRLDYLQDLGITAVWLLPFYPSPLRDGGYDIADYSDVHASYGTRRDVARLLREAHRRGIRVITELVLNHTSSDHEWFQRARRAPPGSRWRNYYVWSDTPNLYQDARIIFKDFETSNWSWDPVAKAYYWHRFYSHQPDLNFDNPEVHAAMFKVVDFWLDMGVDGLRLDAVPYLYERDGTSCENLAETHEFLRKLRAHIDARVKDRMLLAEANQWPADAATYFGRGDECHMNFHFPLMPRMFMALELEDSFPIIDILHQTPVIPETCQWATFLRNHDELTLEMVTDEDRDTMYRFYAEERHARINLGIRRRLAPLLRVRRRIELMNALLFSLPGTPVIYYGDEIGMGDNIYLGDRDGVRTPMQWSGDRNAGFSRCNPQRLYLPIIVDPEYHYEAINVEAQQQNPSSLLWWMKRLIMLRKQHKVFGRGSVELLRPDNPKVLAFVRAHEDQRVLVVANLSRHGQYVELDLSRFQEMVPVELFGRTRFPEIGGRPYFLSLGPHDFFWFALEPAAPPSAGAEAQATPRLSAKGSWTALLEAGGLRTLAPALLDYVITRRWFRGKARARGGASIVDIVPLAREEGGPATHHLLLLRIDYLHGASETYVVPVGFAQGEQARDMSARSRHAVIASVTVLPAADEQPPAAPAEGVLYDALHDAELTGALLDAIRGRRVFAGRLGQVQATPYRALKEIPGDAALAPRALDADQSNSAVIYGDRLFLKLFRALEEGMNPELEIGRFLSDQSFGGAPRIVGTIEYRASGREGAANADSRPMSEPATVAVLEELVPHQGDAWHGALEALDLSFDRVLADEDARAHAAPLPAGSLIDAARTEPPPLVHALTGAYLARARLLGQRSAELHLVLARDTKDPAFGREPFTALYQQSLYQSARGMLVRTFDLLRRRLSSLPDASRERARALVAREAEVDARLARIVARKIDAGRIRSHGDYHLGQVLWTGDDFVIIDFEGEPARALSERRYKRSCLRDVAGMLRSFDYAGAAALRSGRVRPEDAGALGVWADTWVAWVSAAFLSGYLRSIAGDGERASPARGSPPLVRLLPSSDEDTLLLLHFYLLEKCIYEIGYELNNRPAWLDIPLRGLAGLLAPEAQPQREP